VRRVARAGKLTAIKVAAIVRAGKPGYHGDGGSLYLQISKYRTATWVFRYRTAAGRLREAGLGSVDTWTLAEARERARRFRQQRDEGKDPIEERRAERLKAKLEAVNAMTFMACAEAYIAANRAAWKNAAHAAQWPSTLKTYVYPAMGDLPVQAVDVGLVMRVLEPIWTTKPETASRLRGRIESVLDWAKARGFREGENPARWRGHLENLLPKKSKVARVEHHAALPYREIGTFFADLRQQDGIAARGLEFAILTAARTGEVIGARWDEINLAEQLWTIPGNRMKSGREHRVPLAEPAVAILRQMAAIRMGDYVFPGQRAGQPLSQMALLMTLRRMGRGDLTVHGFRSAFSDWCAEQTNFPSEVREMALAHVVGDKVEAAYRRGDLFEKRRQLSEAWSRYRGTPAPQGEVIAIGPR
jgi:integrase